MAKKDSLHRMESYQLKFTSERVKETLDAKRARMIERQRVASEELVALEERVQAVLAGEDVPVIQYVWFHDFARQLYRLKKKFMGGKGIGQEVALLIYVWTARKLDEKVLTKVRDEVFAIQEPKK